MSVRRALAIAIGTTLLVTALSYGLPESMAATGVGLGFLAATYLAALRRSHPLPPAHYGLALGGVLEPEPLSARRLARSAASALAWGVGLALIVFPLFWLGWLWWWAPARPFRPAAPPALDNDVLGQLLVIALPEEAFYRGYLQTALDDAWQKRVRVLGASVGPGLLVASALFAVGHVLTEIHPNRLAVFFPALLFGWLRAKTGSIGAAVVFHALCNLFAQFLARSYGLAH